MSMTEAEDIGSETAAPRMDIQWLIDSDLDGLLDRPDKPKKVTSSDRLERAFLEIIEFRRTHDRLPSSTTREIAERKLGARLDGILADDEKIAALKHLDEFGLLEVPDAPASIDELLGGDDFNLLADEDGLLDVSDLPKRQHLNGPDAVANRVKAEDFDQFEPLFKQKHGELASGASRLLPFRGRQNIVEGAFLVLNGVMLFIAEVGAPEYKESTIRANLRERLRCIFENGTESSMYRQSLSIRLTEGDGQIVAPVDVTEVLTDDAVSGHIYVLRSLSDDPQIAEMRDLHKIGFSRGPVDKRIVNAAKQPTYLMASVEILADYRAYNLKISALENLLHRVFADVRLDITQIDRKGRDYDPSEWFVVPLPVIDQAIALIISGEIVDYVYDAGSRKLKAIPTV